MAWGIAGSVLVVCLWWGRLGEGGEVKLSDKAAMIGVSVMEANTWSVYNTSYIFGVYGEKSLTLPVSGQLVHVRSEGDVNHGCSDYNHGLPARSWVALIERGTCYFRQKVNRATKQYNASAVIVYDNQPSPGLVMMHSSVSDEVYVFVTQSYGRRLALLVDSGLHVQVNVTDAGLSSSSSASPSLHLPAHNPPSTPFFLCALTTSFLLLYLGLC